MKPKTQTRSRLQAVIDKIWRRPQHPSRTITVTLTPDTTAFTQALQRAGAAIADLNTIGNHMTTLGGAATAWAAAMNGAATPLRRYANHIYIQNIAARERRILATWWQQHLNDLYTDLGLERTTP